MNIRLRIKAARLILYKEQSPEFRMTIMSHGVSAEDAHAATSGAGLLARLIQAVAVIVLPRKAISAIGAYCYKTLAEKK